MSNNNNDYENICLTYGIRNAGELQEQLAAFHLIKYKQINLFVLHVVDDAKTYNEAIIDNFTLNESQFQFLKRMIYGQEQKTN